MGLPDRTLRPIVGAAILLITAAITIALLAFAIAWSPESSPRCFSDVYHSQFPKWLGCAIAIHEVLAATLIAAGAALFGAWLAFIGLQDQIGLARENERDRKRLELERRERHASGEYASIDRATRYIKSIVAGFPDPDVQSIAGGQ
jgi:hypothetical protein